MGAEERTINAEGTRQTLRGRLVVVEGVDGSGKSTQLRLLDKWLLSLGLRVFFTEWNSSDVVKEITSKGKKKALLTPTTFSLLHATDFADRYERKIESFVRYQRKMAKEFRAMERTYGLVRIDGGRAIAEVNADLQARIDSYIASQF